MTRTPNFRRRRIIGLLLVTGLVAPFPATLFGAREVGLWIFAAAGSLVALTLLALPLDKLRRPVDDAKTFRPALHRLVFDPQNPVGVAAFLFELVLVGVIAFTAFMSFTGFGLRAAEPPADARIFAPIMAIGAAVLLWPIVDWFSSCVHVAQNEIHVRMDQQPRIVPLGEIEALVVRHGHRSPMHAGAVLVFRLKDGGRVLLPGTTRDADALLETIERAAGRSLPRIDRPIRKRSA